MLSAGGGAMRPFGEKTGKSEGASGAPPAEPRRKTLLIHFKAENLI